MPSSVSAAIRSAALLFVVTAATTATTQGQASARTVWDGVYTAAQAERGGKAYSEQCAMCHGAEMKAGAGAPSLAGPDFLFSWDKKTAAALADYVRANMPPTAPDSLSDRQVSDVVAAIFKVNGFPAGTNAELPSKKDELEAITIAAAAR
jgi:cytochrome c